MKLIIEVKDGIPVGVPEVVTQEQFDKKTKENPSFMEYEPTEPPKIDKHEFYEKPSFYYKVVGNKVVQKWEKVKEKSKQDKDKIIEEIKNKFYKRTGYTSWKFDEKNLIFVPPVQCTLPVKFNQHPVWDEETKSWKVVDN